LLQTRVDELWHGLGLPLRGEVHESIDLHVAPPYELLIDGIACRNDRSQPVSEGQGGLAEHAYATLFHNRALLVTDELLLALQGAERDIVRGAVEHGIAIPRALKQSCVGDPNEDPDGRPYRVECALAAAATQTITVELSHAQIDAALASDIEPMVGLLHDGLFYELGVRFPRLEFVHSERLRGNEFRTRLNDVSGPVRHGLPADRRLVNAADTDLAQLGVKGLPSRNPATDLPASIVSEADALKCEPAGYTTWDAAGYLILSIAADLRARARFHLSMTQVESTLFRLTKAFPQCVFNVLDRYAITEIAAVLGDLVAENVSIRDLRNVIEAMLSINTEVPRARLIENALLISTRDAQPVVRDQDANRVARITDAVRTSLGRQIVEPLRDDRLERGLPVLRAAVDLETRLRGSAPLSAEEHTRFVQTMATAVAALHTRGRKVAVLTSLAVRRRLRDTIALELPHVPVIAAEEIPVDVLVAPMTPPSQTRGNPHAGERQVSDPVSAE
jgi:flagellar biosynthesis component FlhA